MTATTLVAMARDDWFRGDAWDAETRATFEVKLKRARQSSRAQYLRIKGVELTGSIDGATREAGRQLLRRVLDDYPDDAVQVTMAAADLGKSLADDGYLDEAAVCFRRSLAGLPNVHWGADLGLAETILLGNWSEQYAEAREILDASAARTDPFPATRFRWGLASARLAERQGDAVEAMRSARTALAAVDEHESPFPRHRDLGLAHADEQTIRELNRLATGQV
jgi:hypothetical protein